MTPQMEVLLKAVLKIFLEKLNFLLMYPKNLFRYNRIFRGSIKLGLQKFCYLRINMALTTVTSISGHYSETFNGFFLNKELWQIKQLSAIL